MRSKLSGLIMLVFLFVSVSASGEPQVGSGVEVDTIKYFSIQNFLLSPFPLTDYNFLGGGAKARGMGGAFFAVSNDPTAASWNPAGLSQLDKAQMNLSFSSHMQRREYTSTSDSPSWDFSFGGELKNDANAISFAGVVIPFTLREAELVGEVLYQRLADVYQENSYVTLLDSAFSDTEGDTIENYALPSIDEKVTGKLDKISLSLGAKLFESLSLGAGVNIYAGEFVSDANFFAPVGRTNEVLYVDTTGRNGIRFHPNIKSDYSGFNFTLGFMYMLEKLRLAGVVNTPFTLKEENDVRLLADIIIMGEVSQYSWIRSPLFKTDRKWKMPMMMGFGTSYQLNDLTLAADVELRNYSKTKLTYRENLANPSGNEITTSLEWRDLTQFRIGGEYVLHTKLGDIPIRAGFRNDPQLFKTQLDSSQVYLRMDMQVLGADTFYTPAFVQSNYGVEKGSWVEGSVLSFGTGIAWSQIKFDITYEYARYDDVKKEVFTDIRPFDRGNKVFLDSWERKWFLNQESNNYSRIMISFTGFF
ncbi:MAG: OmpP1/FadL family transporter [Candidatus Zixiibacteriota bacterium]